MTRRVSPTAIAALALVFGLIALLVYGVVAGGSDTSIDSAVQRGERPEAPVRSGLVVGAKNQSTSLAEFRGKVVALNFWASWCKPCEDEAPALERAQRRLGERGFTVLGADMDDLTGKALAFKRRYDLTYPLMRYSSDDAARDFGTRQLPETFVIDRDGRIVALRRGPVDDAWIKRNVDPLVTGPDGATGEVDEQPR
jgi:cytochrome c biogenesis protein CcmG/thiol:disulfide interchange protein DsbE